MTVCFLVYSQVYLSINIFSYIFLNISRKRPATNTFLKEYWEKKNFSISTVAKQHKKYIFLIASVDNEETPVPTTNIPYQFSTVSACYATHVLPVAVSALHFLHLTLKVWSSYWSSHLALRHDRGNITEKSLSTL